MRDFTADSLIGKLQLITGQESYIKDTLSNCLSPFFSWLFFCPFSFGFSRFLCFTLCPPRHRRFLLTILSRRFSFVSFDFFRPYTILSFHTWSSFIHLKSAFSPRRLPFLSPFTRLHQFFFLSIVLPSPPIYLLLFLRTVAPFPPVSLFSYATLFLSSQRYTDALAFRTRSAGARVVVRIITRTHPGYRRRLRRCVKLGNRFGTRNRGERRAGRLRGTVPRRTCISQSRHCQGTVVIIPGYFSSISLTED